MDWSSILRPTWRRRRNGQVFVTEQEGRVLSLPEEALSSAGPSIEELLDIRDRVRTRGSEEGLLGLALSPDFAETGNFFVYYSASGPRRSIISRFAVEAGVERADPDSELVILEVPQPYSNHNGGQLAFGPDGHLYIGLGDGDRQATRWGAGRTLRPCWVDPPHRRIGSDAAGALPGPAGQPLRRRGRSWRNLGLRAA